MEHCDSLCLIHDCKLCFYLFIEKAVIKEGPHFPSCGTGSTWSFAVSVEMVVLHCELSWCYYLHFYLTLIFLSLLIYVGLQTHAGYACVGWRPTCSNWFSLSTIWISQIYLWMSGLQASFFYYWVIMMALCQIFDYVHAILGSPGGTCSCLELSLLFIIIMMNNFR